MADIYTPSEVPQEYDPQYFAEELHRISSQLQVMELPYILLVPQHIAPKKVYEGVVVNADGSNWNPGHGAGLYEYINSIWIPLFSTNQGIVTTTVTVQNTTTETEIYTTTIPAENLHANDISVLKLGGSYDTDSASETWTLKVKIAGTTVHTIVRQSGNNVTAAGWELRFIITIRTEGASGTFLDLVILHDDDTSFADAETSTHSIDTTVDNVLSVTTQWGTAKAANIFRLQQGIVEHKH